MTAEESEYLSKLVNLSSPIVNKTPYGATKTAELDTQFSMDPTYGLTRERYGWYSNDTLFDSSLFNAANGKIELQTTATADDSARIRSAYPGQYIAQTLAEPGLGVLIPEEHIERDDDNLVSLTHGEISIEIVEWDNETDSGITALGLSFEEDGTYVQIRRGNDDIAFVPQEDWNIDSLDGDGPSGLKLEPENGLVYNFPFTWYGHGSLNIAIQDPESGVVQIIHRENIKGDVSLSTPGMPVQLTVENKGTADPLGAELGGMQWATYGSSNLEDEDSGRTTEEARQTGNSYIDQSVVQTENSIDVFAEPGRPLISARRDLDQLESRVSLSLRAVDFFINSGADVYVFIFDEFNPDTALTGASFTPPVTRGTTEESRIETDTQATEYTPSDDAVLRGMLYVKGDKNQAEVITGDSTSRVPIDASVVCTAALPPGANSTYAQPAILSLREGF